jgi:hypothetical protein
MKITNQKLYTSSVAVLRVVVTTPRGGNRSEEELRDVYCEIFRTSVGPLELDKQ